MDIGDVLRDAPRTAALLIEVKPIGEPGRVALMISNMGPEQLSPAESVKVLRVALEIAEEEFPQ